MRLAALEVIGITLAEDRRLVAHRNLQASPEDYSAFLALVSNRMLACPGPRLVTLLNELDRPTGEIGADLPERHSTIGDFRQLRRSIKDSIMKFKTPQG
jgi:hypothetical protein